MLKFVAGFITGVYVAQQFKYQIPDITKVVNGVKDDIVKKVDEYNKEEKK